MKIRKADPAQKSAVLAFYNSLIDDMQALPCHPKWQKGIYPAESFLFDAIDRGELFVCEEESIVGAMILNHRCADGYADAPWGTRAAPEEVTVLHTLAVAVSRMGRGIGKAMVSFAVDYARKAEQKTIRLDVLDGNTPALHLYKRCGFTHVGRIALF